LPPERSAGTIVVGRETLQETPVANVLTEAPPVRTVADLLAKLGGVPARRVRFVPFPGTATEQDVIDIEAREDRLCELVDGVLVEKAMGVEESELAALLIHFLLSFVRPRDMGIVLARMACSVWRPGW
jgi:hypothetical protein